MNKFRGYGDGYFKQFNFIYQEDGYAGVYDNDIHAFYIHIDKVVIIKRVALLKYFILIFEQVH